MKEKCCENNINHDDMNKGIPKNDTRKRRLNNKNNKSDLQKRLKRIEGQVKGIQVMLDEDRYCVDILNQIAAVRSAINAVGNIILENHISGCVYDSVKNDEDNKDEVMAELLNLINRYLK